MCSFKNVFLFFTFSQVSDDNICYLIKTYSKILQNGSRYLHHVMPRMLTIWLDFVPMSKTTTAATTAPGTISYDPNGEILKAFETLDKYYFYTCFSQLTSRITHDNDKVFKTLRVCFDLCVCFFKSQISDYTLRVDHCVSASMPVAYNRHFSIGPTAVRTSNETLQRGVRLCKASSHRIGFDAVDSTI